MIEGFIGIAIFLVMVVMSTLGSVLLAQFFVSKLSVGKRTLVATLLGPGLILLPISLITLVDGGGDGLAAFIGVAIFGMLLSGFISWPVAHFSTRKLHRLTFFEVDTFE